MRKDLGFTPKVDFIQIPFQRGYTMVIKLKLFHESAISPIAYNYIEDISMKAILFEKSYRKYSNLEYWGLKRLKHEFFNNFGNSAVIIVGLGHVLGDRFCHLGGVRHGYTHPRGLDHGTIVFFVAHGNGI